MSRTNSKNKEYPLLWHLLEYDSHNLLSISSLIVFLPWKLFVLPLIKNKTFCLAIAYEVFLDTMDTLKRHVSSFSFASRHISVFVFYVIIGQKLVSQCARRIGCYWRHRNSPRPFQRFQTMENVAAALELGPQMGMWCKLVWELIREGFSIAYFILFRCIYGELLYICTFMHFNGV